MHSLTASLPFPICCRFLCPQPPRARSLHRHANFAEASRSFTDNGVGYVRIYPQSAGTFDAIHTGIKGTVSGQLDGASAGVGAGAGAAAGKA